MKNHNTKYSLNHSTQLIDFAALMQQPDIPGAIRRMLGDIFMVCIFNDEARKVFGERTAPAHVLHIYNYFLKAMVAK